MKCAIFLFPGYVEEMNVHPLIYISGTSFSSVKDAFKSLARHFYYEMLGHLAEEPERLKSHFDNDEFYQSEDFAEFILQKYTVIDQYVEFKFRESFLNLESLGFSFLSPIERALIQEVSGYLQSEKIEWSPLGLELNYSIHSISKLKSFSFILVREYAEKLLWSALDKHVDNFTFFVSGNSIEPKWKYEK